MIRASIVLTCFKEGGYLRQSIESARRNMGSDVELVIVNDASPDEETNQICVEAARAGIRVLRHAGNGGLSAARNTALRHIRGDIVVLLDGDDQLADGAVRAAVEFLDRNKECGFVCGDYVKIDEKGAPLGLVSMAPVFRGRYLAPDLLMDNWILHGSSPVRRSLLERMGGFDESPWLTNAPQDMDFYQRALSAGAKGGRLERVVYNWRMHGSNMHKTQGRVTYDLLSLKNRKILAGLTGRPERQIVAAALHALYAHGDSVNFRRFYRALFTEVGWKNHVRMLGGLFGLRVGKPQSRSSIDLSEGEFARILGGATPLSEERALAGGAGG
jgi:glycosyltransferase involved in cell wall biosynthesis